MYNKNQALIPKFWGQLGDQPYVSSFLLEDLNSFFFNSQV